MSDRGHGQPVATGSISHEPVARTSDVEANQLDAVPGIASIHVQLESIPVGESSPGGDRPSGDTSTALESSPPHPQAGEAKETAADVTGGGEEGKEPVYVTRNPPQTPVLAEEYRYCVRDKLMKPMRAHHCRLCATVSLFAIIFHASDFTSELVCFAIRPSCKFL